MRNNISLHPLISACKLINLTEVKHLVNQQGLFHKKTYINSAEQENEKGGGVLHALAEVDMRQMPMNGELLLEKTTDNFNGEIMNIANYLIDQGADVHKKNSVGYTPLHITCIIGNWCLFQLLIEKGANINALGEYNRTPLHLASYNGHLAMVSFFLKRKAKVNEKTSKEDDCVLTPLHNAALKGHFDIVKSLLSHGAEINAQDINFNTPLAYALANGHVEVANLLKANGGIIPKFTCDLYLMSKLPNENDPGYRNNYIWLENEQNLYYVARGKIEKVTINDINLFKSVLTNDNKDKQHLSSKKIKKHITSNGGHTHEDTMTFKKLLRLAKKSNDKKVSQWLVNEIAKRHSLQLVEECKKESQKFEYYFQKEHQKKIEKRKFTKRFDST
jgi:ankyrin repeat protein